MASWAIRWMSASQIMTRLRAASRRDVIGESRYRSEHHPDRCRRACFASRAGMTRIWRGVTGRLPMMGTGSAATGRRIGSSTCQLAGSFLSRRIPRTCVPMQDACWLCTSGTLTRLAGRLPTRNAGTWCHIKQSGCGVIGVQAAGHCPALLPGRYRPLRNSLVTGFRCP
jgi:hypothetical protein